MGNITIRIMDLPNDIKGLVSEDCEGNYSIYINAHYNYETQAETLEHELRHVERNDFYNSVPILEVEGC